jgi:hypothetical protein
MPAPNDDAERFRRLRDQQLHARDPLKKQRRLDQTIARKHRDSQQAFSLLQMWLEIPHKWRDLCYGALIGLGILLLVPFLLEGIWGTCLGAAAFPLCMVLGFLIGRYEDSKDEIRNLLP